MTHFRLSLFSFFFALAFLLTCLVNPAIADIYKCPTADGSLQFSDVVCADGTTETVTLEFNTALDSSIERQNIADYHLQKKASRGIRQEPNAFLITDSQMEERNTKLANQMASDEQGKNRKSKKQKKSKKNKSKKKKSKTKPKKTDSVK